MTNPGSPSKTQPGFKPELLEVLERRTNAILATENRNGSTQMAPVAFAFDQGRFLFESSATTLKVRNLKERPRARVLVEAPGGTGWVAAVGSTEIVEGVDAQELNTRVIGRYLTEEGKAVWADTVAPLDDVTIVLTPERWSSWDASEMLNVIAKHGYPIERAADWFLPLER